MAYLLPSPIPTATITQTNLDTAMNAASGSAQTTGQLWPKPK